MLEDNKILKNTYYSKIKLYGYSVVEKDTTRIDKIINKIRFYIESHDEKYELTIISFEGNLPLNERLSEISLNKVDTFTLPNDKNAKSIKFFKYLGNNIHLSYGDFLTINRDYKHFEKNDVARWTLNNKFNANFIICEGFGVSLEEEEDIDKQLLDNSLIKEVIDKNLNLGVLYINDLVYDKISKSEMKSIIKNGYEDRESYVPSEKVSELEQLIELKAS